MLYGPEGWGRGRKSKYMVLLRCGRVQFDFSTRQDSLKNQTVLGRTA